MGTLQQDINVRINAALNGIPAVQTFVGLLQKIKDHGNTKVEVSADATQVTQLSTAVDNLSKKIETLKPSKLTELSTALQGLLAGANIVKNLGGSFESITKGISVLRAKGGELVEAVVARAGPIIESVTSKVSSLATALPLVGEGGAEAAVGIGAVAAGAGVAIDVVLLAVAAIAALVAVAAAVTTALAAAVPALVTYALGFASARVSSDDLKQSLIDSLPAHDAYRKKLEESAAKSGEVGKQSRELQGLLFELKSKWNELTSTAGGFVDQIAQRVIPILVQLLRVTAHVVDEILNALGSLTPALDAFFTFTLRQIEVVGKALVWLATRAIAAGKAIAAAIAVGLATGSSIEAATAAKATFDDAVDKLEKAANTNTEFGPGGGRTSDSGAGGKDKKGGGGAKRDKVLPDVSESIFGLNKAEIDAAFNLIKDAFDRQNKLVQEELDQRKITIAQFYEETLRIQDAALGAEITKLESLLKQEEDKLKNATSKIDADLKAGKLTGGQAEADAKKAIELNHTLAAEAQLQAEITKAKRERDALPHDLELKEKADVDALNASLQNQVDAMDRLRGLGPLVDARRQIAEIDELLKQFADNPGMVALLEEWREVVGAIGQAEAALTRYQAAQQLNEAKIVTLQEQGNKNLLAQFISAQKIRTIRLQELKDLQETLKLLEAIAKVQGSTEVLVKIQETKTKIEELKQQTKSLGDTIKDTFIDSATQGLTNFFSGIGDLIAGTKTLGQAFKEMALSIIQSLEQVIAKMLVMLIIKKLLGIFGGEGGDSASGIFDSPLGIPVPGGGVNAAAGDFFSAKIGGRIIRVAEGGHDEVVLSTDPKHRSRTAGLLAMFLQKTKILSDLAAGGWMSADGLSQNVLSRIPRFEAGDFVTAGGPQLGQGGGGNTYKIDMHFPNVRDHRDFKLNQAAIERDLMRAARSGADRFRK